MFFQFVRIAQQVHAHWHDHKNYRCIVGCFSDIARAPNRTRSISIRTQKHSVFPCACGLSLKKKLHDYVITRHSANIKCHYSVFDFVYLFFSKHIRPKITIGHWIIVCSRSDERLSPTVRFSFNVTYSFGALMFIMYLYILIHIRR